MTGLEKIINQIQEDARRDADAVIAQAKENADEILTQARADAQKLQEEILKKSEKDIANYRKRAQSSADLKKRTAILKAKQDTISHMLEKAYEKVCSKDTKTYFDRIERMIRAYAQPAAGVICFSQQDLDRMPKDFSDRIQAAAESVKGSLTLSEKGIRIDNGFVLSYGGIEENCTLRAVFDMKKDDLTDKVHEMLFM